MNFLQRLGLVLAVLFFADAIVYWSLQKPEYIGTDIRACHKQPASVEAIDRMLQAFREGRKEPFHYQSEPFGEVLLVTLSPIDQDGEFIGCVQSILKKDDLDLHTRPT